MTLAGRSRTFVLTVYVLCVAGVGGLFATEAIEPTPAVIANQLTAWLGGFTLGLLTFFAVVRLLLWAGRALLRVWKFVRRD